MKDQQITLARLAYDRYGTVTEYKNYQGNPMPKWEELPAKIQEAWVATVQPELEFRKALSWYAGANYPDDGSGRPAYAYQRHAKAVLNNFPVFPINK